MKLTGCATPAGTEHYRNRFAGKLADEHFRQAHDLSMSSIGIGTYLGNYDAETDAQYRRAIVRSVESGGNVIDSAINYRLQRSERSVGAALQDLAARGFGREEIVVATKGGFVPYDGTPPADVRRYFEATFFEPGIAGPGDFVGNCHCIAPRYLLDQLERSLDNLGLDCIDIYYVHNPEFQLSRVSREEFEARLLSAFEALEGAVAAGKIRMYGTATWNGYRNDPGATDYLSLARVVELAQRAGGAQHHFKAVQLPLNLAMSEALSSANQNVAEQTLTALEAAQALGLTVMCSASILQGQLAKNLPDMIGEALPGLQTDGQRSLQFVRSTPGVTTALVGMKQIEHVDENLRTARVPPARWEQYSKLFQSTA